MDTERIRETIDRGAREITKLRQRIDETFAHRGEGKAQRDLWSNACSEFHSRYAELAFPGGYDGVDERILAGEPLAVEAAICFLECRLLLPLRLCVQAVAAKGKAGTAHSRAVKALCGRPHPRSGMARQQGRLGIWPNPSIERTVLSQLCWPKPAAHVECIQ